MSHLEENARLSHELEETRDTIERLVAEKVGIKKQLKELGRQFEIAMAENLEMREQVAVEHVVDRMKLAAADFEFKFSKALNDKNPDLAQAYSMTAANIDHFRLDLESAIRTQPPTGSGAGPGNAKTDSPK